jgi:large subunit ribosomal protein L6
MCLRWREASGGGVAVSRVGKKPIPVPPEVKVEIGADGILVTGPKGSLRQPPLPGVTVTLAGNIVQVERASDAKPHRQMHGLMRTLIANMVQGVTEGYRKQLQIVGVGYRADLDGRDLVLHLGYSHAIRVPAPEGIAFAIEGKNDVITVSGINKVVVGQVAANIRALRRPEPYKGKGVRYMGEVVRHKAGKTGKV